MLSSVFTKSARDRATTTAVSTGVLLIMVLFALGVYSGMSDTILDLYEQMPDALAAIYGSNDGTPVGLAVGAMYAMIAPAILLAFTISGGNYASVGEERDETLDLLLANPVSRSGVVVPKAAMVAIGAVVIATITWLGVLAMGALLDEGGGNLDVLALSVMLIGLALMFGGLAMAISGWTGRSGLGTGVAAGLAGLSWFVTTVFPVNESLETIAKFTPWYLYTGNDPVNNGIGWWQLITMLGLAVALAGVGVIGVNRRDLKG
jgi:ABC-2 type transport system permease protein